MCIHTYIHTYIHTHTASAAAAQEKIDKARWEDEPLNAIRKGIKEMQARLILIAHKHEQTNEALDAEKKQACMCVCMYAYVCMDAGMYVCTCV